jgi:twinkle protein
VDRPEGSDTLISKKEICPKCGKDNLALYADGHTHCFTAGCGHHSGTTGQPTSSGFKASAVVSSDLLPITVPSQGFQKRRLEPTTLRKYGVGEAGYSGQTVQAYPYTDASGQVVAQKVRLPNKDFGVVKGEGYEGLEKCQLFGQSVYGDRFDKQVVITEGELDALSVAQALDFKVAVVSINTGAGNAAKCLKQNYLWLDRFADIVLWFDDDQPGRDAAEECAKLFKVGKVRLAKAAGHKDASDVLQADRPGDIRTTIYGAATWRPKGIVNAKDSTSSITAPKEKTPFYNWPASMPKLQEMTGGIYPGDVTYIVAGTGVGKSALLRETEYALIQQDVKIGVLSFEDTKRDAMLGIMSVHESERLHLIPLPDPDDAAGMEAYDKRMLRVHHEVFGSGLIELFDPETAEWSLEAIMGYVRYLAKGLDCKGVIIDPLSFIASGIDLSADERRVLDMVAGELAKLAKELGIFLIIAHHLKRTQGVPHEEGAPTSLNELRSSGGMANFATGVIGQERNNQAEGDGWRVTQTRILKPIRRTGKSGLADVLYYGEDGRLVPSTIPFPPIGKPSGEGAPTRSQPFGAVSTDY